MKTKLILIILLLFAPPAHSQQDTIVVLGDSLSAAYGIAPQKGWVNLLQQRLDNGSHRYRVINASISGETSAGGVSRLPRLLAKHQPQIVIIALGANDGLRGLSLNTMQNNLAQMIDQARQAHAKVLLVGMQLPPNYGQQFSQLFFGSFEKLAAEKGTAYAPFLLAGVASDKNLFQADGLHPLAETQPVMLENVWPGLEPLLQ